MIEIMTIVYVAMVVLAAMASVLIFYEIMERKEYLNARHKRMLEDRYRDGYLMGVQEERAKNSILRKMEES